jgi:hypothetical protein
MAHAKLHASSDFFKQLSLDHQQLKLVIDIIETFVSRVSVRGYELRDTRLLLLIDQLESFVDAAKSLLEGFEKLLCMVVVRD